MDDLLKEFIINNRLTLTVLAIVFTPVGLFTGWRFLHRDASASARAPMDEVDRRLEAVELQLDALVTEVVRLSQQQSRLAAVLERGQLPGVRTGSERSAATPV